MFNYKFVEEVKELQKRVSKIYIYGAGFRGQDFLKILRRNNVEIAGYVVTKVSDMDIKDGLPIFEAEDVLRDEKVGIVLGLSDINTMEVLNYLKEQNADFSRIVNGGKYLSEYRGTMDLRSEPFLEVTTVIGCRVNCRFCPQHLLVSTYLKKDKNRKSVMSVDDFKVILGNTPQNCVIMFAGMAEPFLNPNCRELLQLACESGRKVRLYTTLEGATEEDIDAIITMPFQFVGLHIADKMKYAHITTSETYYKMVKKLVNAKKAGSEESFLDDITSQGIPDDRIVQLLNGKFEIITAVQDRAGNLVDEDAVGREGKLSDEKFMCTYCGTLVNNQVVLPDGTILLCQMDYGMKHALGNILEKNYDEIRQGDEMKVIFEAMRGNRICEVLCDTCLYAKAEK